MLQFTISEVKNLIISFYKILEKYGVRIPLLINGPTGVGKTSVVQEVAAELQLNFIDFKISLIPQVVSGGIPVVHGEQAFTLVPHESVYEACKTPSLLFLDELSLGSEFSTVLSLLFGGRIFNNSLHPKTYIVSACNTGAHYDTNLLPWQVLARFAVANVKYSSENFDYLLETTELYHLAPLAEKFLTAWEQGDVNEVLYPVECPRTSFYALIVLKAFYENLYDKETAFKMLTTLTKFARDLLEIPREDLVFEMIKKGIKIDFDYNMDSLFTIIGKHFNKVETSEKINILKFVISVALASDVKAGFLKQLFASISENEKMEIYKQAPDVISKITKITKGYII